jgi:hypothetical protein
MGMHYSVRIEGKILSVTALYLFFTYSSQGVSAEAGKGREEFLLFVIKRFLYSV